MSKKLIAVLFVLNSIFAFAQTDSAAAKKPRPMSWKDVSSWKYINTFSFQQSPNGKWAAYPLTPVEGDGELIVKKLKDSIERKYAIGSAAFASFAFSEDGNWLAYKESPSFKDTKAAAKNPGKQLFDKLCLIELATGKKTVFEKAGSFAFNGKASSHLAVSILKERSPAAKPEDPKGSDLLLVQLATGKVLNIGNAGEFAFNKQGSYLAYTIDAAGKTGNGLFLYSIASRQTSVLDNDRMSYKSLAWHKEADAFTVLKMNKDDKYKTEKGVLIGVKDIAATPAVIIYDPSKDTLAFPKGMTISSTRQPLWSDDLTRVFFGIHELKPEKKETPASDSTKKDSAATAKKEPKEDAVKPDMTIWNWQDRRLQSRQQVTESQDKDFSYWCMYDATASKFIRLCDTAMRSLAIFPKQHYALGQDISSYELDQNLDGQNYADLYIVDLKTGKKTKWKEKFYLPSYASFPGASPDGKQLLYGFDGQYFIYNIAENTNVNITQRIATSFLDTEDDHNVRKPLTEALGWSSDNKFVLIGDRWDIWQIPVNGRDAAVNLTINGQTTQTRSTFRFTLDPEEKGIDLSKPVYIRLYGEWTKKSGIGRIMPGRNGLKPGVGPLVWEDAAVTGLSKAKNADTYTFSRELFNKAPEFFIADATLKNGEQITHNAPDAKKYTWSSGVQLVNYVSAKGDSLQGALFLPAGYEQGKKYPTIVYYYEKLSQTLHNYSTPSYSRTGWNPTMYTSNGYAVFIPDIVYKMDDPGMSAVWCVLPAVKAAVKTGVIDENNIGIHGHSWGGYQTAFLVTQTNMFKAAAAGAALTDLVSMYDLIYWNSGGGNMAIFEASQGRFTGGPWENWDAYQRNSPIYHVKDIKTPLLMLHNDKDGAVDFTQGIEFYNALRRLKKPVVMIQYKGENHGLAKIENRKDYSVRMMEFFDYHLKGAPAPDWLSKGVDRLNMDEHLDTRTMNADEMNASQTNTGQQP